ncbi:unnamed protein product [Ectocarpus fasciculatus]
MAHTHILLLPQRHCRQSTHTNGNSDNTKCMESLRAQRRNGRRWPRTATIINSDTETGGCTRTPICTPPFAPRFHQRNNNNPVASNQARTEQLANPCTTLLIYSTRSSGVCSCKTVFPAE